MQVHHTGVGLTSQEAESRAGGASPEKYGEVEVYLPGADEPLVVRRDPANGVLVVNPFRNPASQPLIQGFEKTGLLALKAQGRLTDTTIRAARGNAPIKEWDQLRLSLSRDETDRLDEATLARIRDAVIAVLERDPRGNGGERMVAAWPWHTDTGNAHLDIMVHRHAVNLQAGYASETIDLGKLAARQAEVLNAVLQEQGLPLVQDWRGPGGNSIYAPVGERGEAREDADLAIQAAGGRPVAAAPVPAARVPGADAPDADEAPTVVPFPQQQARRPAFDPEEERLIRYREAERKRLADIQAEIERKQQEAAVAARLVADADHALEALTQAREARIEADAARRAAEQAEVARQAADTAAIRAKADLAVETERANTAEAQAIRHKAAAEEADQRAQKATIDLGIQKAAVSDAHEWLRDYADAAPEDRADLPPPEGNELAAAVAGVLEQVTGEHVAALAKALDDAAMKADADKAEALRLAAEQAEQDKAAAVAIARQEGAEAKAEELQPTIDDLTEANGNLKKDLDDANTDRQRLAKELDDAKKDYAREHQRAEGLAKDNDGLRDDLTESRAEAKTLRQQVAEAIAATKKAVEDAKKAVEDAVAPLNQKIEGLSNWLRGPLDRLLAERRRVGVEGDDEALVQIVRNRRRGPGDDEPGPGGSAPPTPRTPPAGGGTPRPGGGSQTGPAPGFPKSVEDVADRIRDRKDRLPPAAPPSGDDDYTGPGGMGGGRGGGGRTI